MGLLGNALGAIGKIGGAAAGAAGGGGGGEGIAGALQKGLELFGGIKGLVDQAKGLGGDQKAAAAEQPQGGDQKAGDQKAGGDENPLMRLAKMILDADPKDLEKLVKDLKGKVPKELAGVIDKLVEAKQQAGQAGQQAA